MASHKFQENRTRVIETPGMLWAASVQTVVDQATCERPRTAAQYMAHAYLTG
jgi:hypothetical protein